MKNKLLAFVTLGILTGPAHAQSSVTLYGLIDVGFVYSNNVATNGQGAKLYSLASGNLQGSRWGLRGTEDLGGGLKTIFVLENGFSVVNGRLGQGGDLFGRQAFVGISSSQFGTVTLGRQYDSVVDYTGIFGSAAQWATYYGSHPGDLDNMLNTNRVNNAIKYTSNDFAGFKFGGLYSLGGVAGQFNRNQIWSVGAGYSNGPLQLGAAYLNVKDPNFSFFGNNATSSTTASNMSGSRVYSGYASAGTQQVVAAGGAYTFGAATVGATYSNTQFQDIGTLPGLPATGAGGTAKFHNAEANFKYQLTTALLLGLAYDYTKGYGVNEAKYHQVALGADYFLSRRTDLYLTGIYQHASGTDSTGTPAVANISLFSPSSTSNQVAATVGIRHK
ncbi:porin, partial [Paraburkholderia ultramafica]|uniref:porin n=1 Tax=Paraburkholderia ultramafica TaxID=1544867 RepID=UPI001581F1A6